MRTKLPFLLALALISAIGHARTDMQMNREQDLVEQPRENSLRIDDSCSR